ncbi:type II toxin-antitoxin system Phd/YefM family antitoxin [Marinobacter lacisalsi]|uniref:Antitoxin n=1 Tax=Marinobacter lacisalsi TaxID=475979 RepID=A0ABV8QLB1_9GAMM
MQTITVRETKERLEQLLDAVAAGEDIVIVRRGKPAARLTAVAPGAVQFPDSAALRGMLPPVRENSTRAVRSLREEQRF